MQQHTVPLWKGIFRFVLKRIILVLTLMFCIGLGIALANMRSLSSSLIESQARQSAELYIQTLNQAIDLYSFAAVDRAKTVDGVEVTHAYLSDDGAIPLPSTFAIELGDRISDQNPNMAMFRFYSDYPFPWRKDGGPKDAFESEALKHLRDNPKKPFFWTERDGEHVIFRYGEASIMKPSCVSCHNTHPESPYRNWEVGDVAGVWEVNQPLDSLVGKVNTHLRGTFAMLGGISGMGIVGLTLVIGKLRQTARQLEWRVQERTADLAQVNADLENRNQLIRQVFGRYLSNDVVSNLLESPSRLELGGDRRTVTILTSDLRGFTALSERLQPEDVIQILNLYLERMAEVINRYQGTIDEFMGDGILVLFGAPAQRQDDALRAVACACAMQLAMGGVNELMQQRNLPRLAMGIGIHTGEVVVGNIGSEQRTKYGIVGSPVNLTYRIESYTKGGQILISAATLQAAGTSVKTQSQQQVHPKGAQHPITVYDVSGVAGSHSLYLPREEERFFPVARPIPLQFTLVEGKQISQTEFKGRLVQLSEQGAEIQVAEARDLPPELTNLKLNLLLAVRSANGSANQSANPMIKQMPRLSDDLYAKVLDRQPAQNCFRVQFTTVPPSLQTKLDALYRAEMVGAEPVVEG
jgi:adenylate cyclase